MAMKLQVGNLPWSFTSVELAQLFRTYGIVESADVSADQKTGQSLGFGTVEMDSNQAGHEAISALNYSTLKGKALTVRMAPSRSWPVIGAVLLVAALAVAACAFVVLRYLY